MVLVFSGVYTERPKIFVLCHRETKPVAIYTRHPKENELVQLFFLHPDLYDFEIFFALKDILKAVEQVEMFIIGHMRELGLSTTVF